jgi:hypothetical protein
MWPPIEGWVGFMRWYPNGVFEKSISETKQKKAPKGKRNILLIWRDEVLSTTFLYLASLSGVFVELS